MAWAPDSTVDFHTCWKTYLGRPEADDSRHMAMNVLGNGLYNARHHEEALAVYEAELSVLRRFGAPEEELLVVQGNIANTYQVLGRHEDALHLKRDVYSGCLKLNGEEDKATLAAALRCASTLSDLERFEEAKSLMRKNIPVARRVLGDDDDTTLRARWSYARSLYRDTGATLDDLREAVTTFEETARTARRVLGSAHPTTTGIENGLQKARTVLHASETRDMLAAAARTFARG